MRNLKEKLEIMEWLYEKRLNPEMWFSEDYLKWSVEKRTEEDIKYSSDECEYIAYDKPWFPLEQVWSLLPNCLGDYRYLKGIVNNCVGYLDQGKENPIEEKMLFEFVESDIHLAALKLLKQILENRECYTANKLGPIEPEEVNYDLNSYNLNEDYK